MKLTIPDGITFADLQLARISDGDVELSWHVVEAICEASGIDPAVFAESSEDNLAGLINAWYREHLARGGEPDPVQEDLIAEARLEDERGGGLSHQPGRA